MSGKPRRCAAQWKHTSVKRRAEHAAQKQHAGHTRYVAYGIATMREARRVTGARELGARIRWFWREFTGESAYDRYVAHTRRRDPYSSVLSRREFERRRTDAREANPREGFRCC